MLTYSQLFILFIVLETIFTPYDWYYWTAQDSFKRFSYFICRLAWWLVLTWLALEPVNTILKGG